MPEAALADLAAALNATAVLVIGGIADIDATIRGDRLELAPLLKALPRSGSSRGSAMSNVSRARARSSDVTAGGRRKWNEWCPQRRYYAWWRPTPAKQRREAC
jgi:hypothetical protein